MTETPLDEPELPPSLRFLKRLVTVLTITMIAGVITVVGLLVTRLSHMTTGPSLPANLSLPAGTRATAVTFGTGWIAVVTTDDHILIYDDGGKLRQDVVIEKGTP